MSTSAIVFMAGSWTFVLGLTFWAFYKLLQDKKHFDPDGIGPAAPEVPAETERPKG
ncbi:MAG: hypothetical protein ACYC1W_12090 [Gemmatimonadaceae bacterium]